MRTAMRARRKKLCPHIVRGQLQYKFTTAFLDLLPGSKSVFIRQRLKNSSDLAYRKAAQEIVQFDQMLAVHQPLDQRVMRHVLFLDYRFDTPLTRKQQLHITQVLFKEVLRARTLINYFRHGIYSTLTANIYSMAECLSGHEIVGLARTGQVPVAPTQSPVQ